MFGWLRSYLRERRLRYEERVASELRDEEDRQIHQAAEFWKALMLEEMKRPGVDVKLAAETSIESALPRQLYSLRTRLLVVDYLAETWTKNSYGVGVWNWYSEVYLPWERQRLREFKSVPIEGVAEEWAAAIAAEVVLSSCSVRTAAESTVESCLGRQGFGAENAKRIASEVLGLLPAVASQKNQNKFSCLWLCCCVC